MRTFYLTLRSFIKPIEVQFKGNPNQIELIADYLEIYGSDFIALASSYDEAIELQKADYELFGDTQPSANLNDIIHLENCLSL